MSTTDKVKLPEPFWHAVVSKFEPVINKAIRRADVAEEYAQGYKGAEVIPLHTEAQMLAMHEQGRLAGLEEAAEACDDVEEPRYYGYENPNTFSDGKAACMSAIRALAAASIGAKMGEE
jgi:hypothetical protein